MITLTTADEDVVDALRRIDASLRALLLLLVQYIPDDKDRPEARKLERLFHMAGLNQGEIAELTNQSQPNVSKKLKAEGLT